MGNKIEQHLSFEDDKSSDVNKKNGEEEKELLNLIAEIIVEIIIKDSQNERDRICEDQQKGPV